MANARCLDSINLTAAFQRIAKLADHANSGALREAVLSSPVFHTMAGAVSPHSPQCYILLALPSVSICRLEPAFAVFWVLSLRSKQHRNTYPQPGGQAAVCAL